MVPPLRAAELPVEVELAGGSLADKGLAVVEAAAGGQLNPTQAASLLSAMGALAQIVEDDELLGRNEALERKHGLGARETTTFGPLSHESSIAAARSTAASWSMRPACPWFASRL